MKAIQHSVGLLITLVLSALFLPVQCDIQVAAILPQTTTYAGPLLSALVRLAAKEINTNGIQGQQLQLQVFDSHSDPSSSIYAAVELSANTSAVIGEYSNELTQLIQFVLSKNNIPQIVPTTDLTNITNFPTLVQNVGSTTQEAVAIVSLIASFGWGQFAVIADGTDPYSNDLASAVSSQAVAAGLEVTSVASIGIQNVDISAALKTVDTDSLIVVLLTSGDEALQVLDAASGQGKLGNGTGYTWILGDAAAAGLDGYFRAGLLKSSNLSFPLTGCIGVVPSSGKGTTAYSNFLSVLNANAGFDSTLSAGSSTYIPPYAASYYDAVFLLSDALSHVISAGGTVTDGAAVLKAIKSSSYSGVTGAQYAGQFEILNWKNAAEGFEFVAVLDVDATNPPSGVIFPDGTTNIPLDVSSDILIGVIYPFSTLTPLTNNWYSLTRLAFNDINGAGIIPGYKMRAIYTDDASSPSQGIEDALNLLSNKVVAFLGPLQASVTVPVVQTIDNFKIPVLSFVTTIPTVSDKTLYPYFVRNVPPDNLQTGVMAQLVYNFGWKRIAVLYSQESYGQQDSQAFVAACKTLNINIELMIGFNPDITDFSSIYQEIENADLRIVLVFTTVNDCYQLFVEANRAGVLSDGWVFFTSDTCASFGADSLLPPGLTAEEIGAFHNSIKGVFSMVPFAGGGPDFDAFVARLESLDPKEYPDLLPFVVYATYGYDAPWMYAYAFKRLLDKGIPFSNGTALLQELYNTNFTGITGPTTINKDGDRIGEYSVLNWQCGPECAEYTTVGLWNPNNPTDFNLNMSGLLFLGGSSTVPSDSPPGYGGTVLGYLQPLSIGLGVVTGLCIILWFLIAIYFVLKYRYFRRFNSSFCGLILLGVAVGYVSILTLFPKPTPHLCMAFPWISSMGFVLVYGSIFTKTWALWRLFHASENFKKFKLSMATLRTIIGVGIAIESILMIIWVAKDPPKVVLTSTFTVGTSYYSCSSVSDGWWIAYIALKGVQLLIGVFITFKVRNVMDEYNESRAIGLCIYNATILGIIAILLGFLLRPINGSEIIIPAIALIFAFTFPLVAIFVPKIIYITANKVTIDSETEKRRKVITLGQLGLKTTSSEISSSSSVAEPQESMDRAWNVQMNNTSTTLNSSVSESK